jgi:DNA-directed RNA polymerase specialized sigma24 family protein
MTNGGARPPNRSLRISPVDSLGRSISPSVLDAAEEIGRRAIEHAEKHLLDPAVAADLLEEAAATVSRAIDKKNHCTKNPIRDLPSYLFRAFIRLVNKAKKRQLSYEDSIRISSVGSHNATDPRAELELKIFIGQVLTTCDPMIRDMFYRRLQGFSWKEIGLFYGISKDDAKSRFCQALHKMRDRLGLESDL